MFLGNKMVIIALTFFVKFLVIFWWKEKWIRINFIYNYIKYLLNLSFQPLNFSVLPIFLIHKLKAFLLKLCHFTFLYERTWLSGNNQSYNLSKTADKFQKQLWIYSVSNLFWKTYLILLVLSLRRWLFLFLSVSSLVLFSSSCSMGILLYLKLCLWVHLQ